MLVISTIIYQQVHVPLTHSLLHSTKTDLAKIQFSNWPLHFTRHALSHFICLFLLEQAPLVGFWCFFGSSKVPWWVCGVFGVFFARARSPGGWSHSWLELPCCAMSKCSPAFFSTAFCKISPSSVAAKLRCNAIRRTDHLKFPVPIMASAPTPPLEKSWYKTKRCDKF